jgi:HPt (histidine-containing phosphotransfer) domain-containing protein
MSASDPAISALIEAARIEFAGGLEAKAAALEALVGNGAWVDARRAAHKLRGSAGVYGFAALGEAAAVLDDLMCGAGGSPDAEACARIREKLDDVRSEAERASREAR